MNNIDPDVLTALQTVFEARRASHVGKVYAKQREQTKAQLETKIELLFDEVATVIDPKHPAFLLVLALAVVEKVERNTREPEFRSFVDENFPEGW